MEEEMSCGVATLNEPFSYNKVNEKHYQVLCDGEMISYFVGSMPTDRIEIIVDMLNDAYQKGYHKCGTELMPKVMEK